MPKILLVEDDPVSAEFVMVYLRQKKLDVVLASDASTAVSLCQSERPAVVLMDMWLPMRGDGLRATRAIRALPGMQSLPIIAMTAQNMPDEVEEMYQAGCTDLVSKPVELKHLLGKIHILLASEAKS